MIRCTIQDWQVDTEKGYALLQVVIKKKRAGFIESAIQIASYLETDNFIRPVAPSLLAELATLDGEAPGDRSRRPARRPPTRADSVRRSGRANARSAIAFSFAVLLRCRLR